MTDYYCSHCTEECLAHIEDFGNTPSHHEYAPVSHCCGAPIVDSEGNDIPINVRDLYEQAGE
jgi:hypothetical protein